MANRHGLARERMVSGRYAGIADSLRLLREVNASGQERSGVRLGERDRAVLQALDQYRYLDTRQLRWLFFTRLRLDGACESDALRAYDLATGLSWNRDRKIAGTTRS